MTDAALCRAPCPVAAAARQRGLNVAVGVPGGPLLSYSEFDRRINQVARELSAWQVAPGNRIGLIAETDLESLLTFWAILRLGAIACPISPRWPTAAVQDVAGGLGIRPVLGAEHLASLLARANSQDPRPLSVAPRPIDQAATILFSSGSTAKPKAIAHSLDAHLASALGSAHNLPLQPSDRWLLSLPLHHVSGLGILFRCALAKASVIIPARNIPAGNASWTEQLRSSQATHLSLVPTQLQRLLSEGSDPPAHLKAILLGGAPVPRELVMRATERRWPIHTTYGLTEMGSQVTTTAPGATRAELETAGRRLPEREVQVASDGEILVRGRTLCLGYVDGESIHLPVDDQGWFHTRDLGRWDENENLIVLGRIDNLFISGGENIHPEEIERHLLDLPGIQQAVVVPVPHVEFGQRPVAFVDGDLANADRWVSHLTQRLARFKIPDLFLAWPPQSGLKPNRAELAAIARQRVGPGTGQGSDEAPGSPNVLG